MRALLGALLVLVSVSACSRPLPAAFTKELDAAKASYSRGEYRNAALGFEKAAAVAPNSRERDEAEYLRGASLEREGDLAAADNVYASLERGSGQRAERAAFERAELLLTQGRSSAGYARLRRAVLKYPQSGLSERAAQRLLSHVAETRGVPAAHEECERLLRRARGTELEPRLDFERARLLEKLEQPEAAKNAYLELARRFPYPSVYWDDALDAAARIDEARGRYASAIGHLERLLGERESSKIAGSYERAIYASARFHIGEMYRDRLNDPERARREFRRVFLDHPTTDLRDDALFEEALIALGRADPDGACETARLLRDEQPESRYARCARALCPTLPEQTAGCRAYILDRISAAAKRSSE